MVSAMFTLLILVAINNVLSETKVFYKDDVTGILVLDNITSSLKDFQFFREQLLEYPMDFHIRDEEKFLDFKTMGGYRSNVLPNRYLTKFALNLTDAIVNNYPGSLPSLTITEFADQVLERNDMNPVITECSREKSKLITLVYLNEWWRKDGYGDVAIYDDNDEIIISFHPKLGRVVVMPCGTKYKVNPPSMGNSQKLFLRYIEYTITDRKRFLRLPNQNVDEPSYIELFNIPNTTETENEKKINYSDYLVKRFQTPSKKSVLVYDNLFPEEITNRLYKWVKEYAYYFSGEIERNESRVYRGDNRLTDTMVEEKFPQLPLYKFVKNMLTDLLGIDTYFYYSTFIPAIRRHTHNMVHRDGITEDKEWTAVIYLNPGWNESWHGETVFIEDGMLVAGVLPKWGRMTLFEGSIEHSGRNPSPNFNGARYSFVVKMSNSTESAVEKQNKDQNCCTPIDEPWI